MNVLFEQLWSKVLATNQELGTTDQKSSKGFAFTELLLKKKEGSRFCKIHSNELGIDDSATPFQVVKISYSKSRANKYFSTFERGRQSSSRGKYLDFPSSTISFTNEVQHPQGQHNCAN